MTVVASLHLDNPPGGRLVWGGRAADGDQLDGWTTDRASLLRQLGGATDLVVLDAMSFPWESLRPDDRSIPLTAVLPAELDAEAMGASLGQPLLAHVTPFDRLVEPRAEVRDALAATWQVPDSAWIDQPPAASTDPSARARKSVWRQVHGSITDVVRTALRNDDLDVHHIAVSGSDPSLAQALGRELGSPVRVLDTSAAGSAGPLEHVVVVTLGGDRTTDARVERIAAAHRRLRSGGLFVLVATVVALPDDAPGSVPSMDDLVRELQLGTGLGLHVHDIRPLRWAREPLIRGVLVAGRSVSVSTPEVRS